MKIIDNSVGHNLKVAIFPIIMRFYEHFMCHRELILRHTHLKFEMR
jgi:hypothetical protein